MLLLGCHSSARVEAACSHRNISARACSPLVATDGARRGPRLAQGAQETLQLRRFIEGVYQGTTYPKRSGLRADLTAPRPRAARAVQIDFRRGAVKRVKKGAFSRVCIGELES